MVHFNLGSPCLEKEIKNLSIIKDVIFETEVCNLDASGTKGNRLYH
jgi:hypothetical protein